MTKLKVEVQVAGNSIIFPLQDDQIPKATSALIAKGISIYGVSTITKNLEEIFMEIIEKHRNKSASVAIF